MDKVSFRALAASLMGGAAVVTLLAGPQGGQSPTFRGGVDLVMVDLLALSKTGDPVRDLTQDQVSVRLNGRERPIRSFQFIPLDQAGRSEQAVEPEALPAPFGSNSPTEQGRTVLLLLDDDSIGPGDEQRVREAVDTFLKALAPRDRVALMTAPFGVVKVNFTTEHARIRQALSQVTGRAPSRTSFIDFGCRTRQTLDAITNAIRAFRRGEGLSVVVVLSGGLMEPRSETGRIAPANPVTGERPASSPDACDVLPNDYKKLRETAGGSGLHYFVARADRRNPPPPVDDGVGRSLNIVAGLEHLASALDAPLINLHGSDGSPLLRVAQRTAGYYLLGIEPDAADRIGDHRPLEVRTTRSGVSLSAPLTVLVPRPPVTVGAALTDAADLLRVSWVFRDLPMRVSATVAREQGDTLKIVVLGEATDPKATLTSAAIGLVDGNGRLAGEWKPDSGTPVPSRLIAAFAGTGGSYRVRVAAIDSQGRSGTADYDFTAELTRAGNLRLSDLLLGVARETGFTPVLVFGTESVATVYLELYGATADSKVRAAFDIAESLNGPAIRSQVAVFAGTNEPDKFVATAALPIGNLPPGDYVVRAAVAMENQPATRVVRAMRIAR
jgi:hypothetical protein